MKTLKLDFSIYRSIEIRLKGLSFKALPTFSDAKHDLIRADYKTNAYCLDVQSYHINKHTVKPELDWLIPRLKEIKDAIPFDKIKIVGGYQINGDEMMLLLNKK